MARTRSLNPGFFKNEDLLDLPPITRLLFAGLWGIADREGRLEDRPKRIKIDVLPNDACDVDEMLDALTAANLIVRYEYEGKGYIAIPTFLKHQHPHIDESRSKIPPPPVYSQNGHHAHTAEAPAEHGSGTVVASSGILDIQVIQVNRLPPFPPPPRFIKTR